MPKWLRQPKGSPYWHYDFWITGCRFFGSTKTDRLALARKIVDGIRAQVLTGTFAKRAPEMTVDDAFGTWFTEHGVHLKERDNFNARFGRMLDHFGKGMLLSELSTAQLAGYVAKARASNKPGTVNHDLRTLRRVLSRARDVWGVALPPKILWARLLLIEPAPRERHLSHDEEERLLAELPADFRVVVQFAIVTGGRLMSVLRLRWADVDDDARTLTFRDVKSHREGERHTVPITADVRALLGSRRGQHAEFVFTYRCQRTTRDRKGGIREAGKRYPFSGTGWRRQWKRALAAAGIVDLRFHDTRHTAATRLTKEKGNLRLTQRALGHRNIATTARYAHVLVEDVAEAMEAVSRNLPEKKDRPGGPGRLSSSIHRETGEQDHDGTPAPKAGALPG